MKKILYYSLLKISRGKIFFLGRDCPDTLYVCLCNIHNILNPRFIIHAYLTLNANSNEGYNIHVSICGKWTYFEPGINRSNVINPINRLALLPRQISTSCITYLTHTHTRTRAHTHTRRRSSRISRN